MALVNIYSFVGTSYNDGSFTFVTVKFDNVNIDIIAQKSNGGFPSIYYDEYSPDEVEGTIIGNLVIGTVQYNFYWIPYYPFAYYDTEEVTPPTYNLTVSAISTNETAPNENDGTATVTASGGASPYEYSINNVDWQSSNVFSNLSFGNYTVFVRDSSTGLGQASFIIQQGAYPPAPPVIIPLPDIICLSGGELERQGAYKRAIVKTEFGTTPSTLFNGDFEQYDGQNWAQWVRYGGISLSRGQRTVKDGSGNVIPIENYTLMFNQIANAGKYLEHTIIPIKKGDTGKFSVNIGTTPGTGTTSGTQYVPVIGNTPTIVSVSYEFRMRIKVGNFYLYNVNGGNSYEWVSQLAVITTKVDNVNGNIDSYVFSFNIPEAPVTGNIIIDLFGFVKIKEVQIVVTGQVIRAELSEYDPIQIDDIKLSLSSQNKDNDTDGIISISDNLDYYSKPLDQINIPIGDIYVGDIGKDEFETLYVIYDQNGKPTTGWIDFGVNTNPLPLGLQLAKSVIQSYQASYWQFTGSLMLKENAERFSYLDTFSFIVNFVESGLPATDFNSNQFVLLGCDIDLKENIMSNITMREYFRRVAKTNDISIPVTNNTPLPPIVNDPNNNQLIGVFTEEFTDIYN